MVVTTRSGLARVGVEVEVLPARSMHLLGHPAVPGEPPDDPWFDLRVDARAAAPRWSQLGSACVVALAERDDSPE
jgi:hypothetical protein